MNVVRKNTTIPVDLAEKAEEAGINFSATLTEALKEKLRVQFVGLFLHTASG
ncbi:type II toxin-antitoxin system CcdA family antitoxin [Trichococcus patagoniensis]|uniref:type II toxin-antitoxin system CcdA family antitoxin n=1 Tax=Trichococcus patagoniensis TaxID=382641 RepID=UPI003CCC18A7